MRHKAPTAVVLFTALMSLGVPVADAYPGQLDPSFGSGGVVVTKEVNSQDSALAVFPTVDAKMLLVGSSLSLGDAGDSSYDGAMRVTSSGSLDRSYADHGQFVIGDRDLSAAAFSPDGATAYTAGNSNGPRLAEGGYEWAPGNGVPLASLGFASVEALLVQPDGKLVAAGNYDDGLGRDFLAVRFDQALHVDTTFGVGGRALVDMGGDDSLHAIGRDSENRLVLAGTSTTNGNADIAVARLAANGALDSTFNGGRVKTSFFNSMDEGQSLTVQSDDRILVGGSSNGQFALIRYTSTGALDSSFDGDGKVRDSRVGPATSERVGRDGSIIAVSQTVVTRRNADGSIGSTFGTRGIALLGMIASNDDNALMLQADDRIVVAGTATKEAVEDAWGGVRAHVGLVRLTNAGAMDSSFGVGGLSVQWFEHGYTPLSAVGSLSDGTVQVIGTSNRPYAGESGGTNSGGVMYRYSPNGRIVALHGTGQSDAYGMVIQPDGKTVVVGSIFYYACRNALYVTRLLADGTRDGLFGGSGHYVLDNDPGCAVDSDDGDSQANAVALQSDGKIVIAGESLLGGIIVRLLPDGTPDLTFGTGGILREPRARRFTALRIRAGRVIVTGSDGSDAVVGRYTLSGLPDTSFGSSGLRTIDFGGDDTGTALALQDGRPVVTVVTVTSSYPVLTREARVIRLTTSGQLDYSFGYSGQVRVASGTDNSLQSLTMQADGRILVAGAVDGEVLVLRLTPNGLRDQTFGPSGTRQLAFGSPASDVAIAASLAGGKLLVAGHTGNDALVLRELLR